MAPVCESPPYETFPSQNTTRPTSRIYARTKLFTRSADAPLLYGQPTFIRFISFRERLHLVDRTESLPIVVGTLKAWFLASVWCRGVVPASHISQFLLLLRNPVAVCFVTASLISSHPRIKTRNHWLVRFYRFQPNI